MTANHCEYLWNWSQQHDFHQCWAKNCMGIPWVIPEIHWFWLKQFLLTILSTFHLLKIWKIKFCCKPLSICVKLVKTTWLSPLLSKTLHGTTLSHTCDTLILLKTAYFKHFEHFPGTENLKNKILLQTTVNMCETGDKNMTFTPVEQKIAWE